MRLKWIAVSVCTTIFVSGALAQSGFGQPRQGGQAPRAQQGFGRMMGMNMAGMLLERPDVQRELNLTEQQKNQIRQMQENQRVAMQELRNLPPQERRQKMRELREKNDPTKVLNETQKKRLHEIELQAMGAFALLQPEVADQLKLTQEQRLETAGHPHAIDAADARAVPRWWVRTRTGRPALSADARADGEADAGSVDPSAAAAVAADAGQAIPV